ncbi:MAG TPA: xanthine dehydrogenase family protein molybdopterin-binding subunit [Cyclobacteriaceae bacterium]|nr:xanthine dehydrogenase family protein molybdopterin-binding subunit [Cyclobacteriaceae bacterium]
MTASKVSRRSFLKVTALAGGGLMIGFHALSKETAAVALADEVFIPNAFIKIDGAGIVTLMAPNPEVGQGIKTALPMLVAEELEIDWSKVVIEQAPLNTKDYTRQVAGGSGSIRSSWDSFRKAGATARHMLIDAAAQTWSVPFEECYAEKGFVIHKPSGKKLGYGELASKAASITAPADVKLKESKDYKLIGTRVRNIDTKSIITGKPLYGIDTKIDGMLYAMVARPPAFGKKLKSVDDTAARAIPGVKNVVSWENKVAVLATSTWLAKKGRDALKLEWEDDGKLDTTEDMTESFKQLVQKKHEQPKRKDGDVEAALASASKVIERVFEAPFLSHAPMEPMNFFAHVKDDGTVWMTGPTQTPARTRAEVAKALNIPEDKIFVGMTRQGGGFGRRLQADYSVEAAMVSSLAKAPVQVIWTREDDQQGGYYRPMGMYRYRAAIDSNNEFSAWYLIAVGVNQGNASRENAFPAGAVPNFQVDSHNYESKITTGPWRAPNHNFIAFTEESFIDEIAHTLKKDPVAFRLEMLDRAKANAFGKLDADADRYKAVIKMAAEMGKWGTQGVKGVYKGFGAHFSFGTYVAQVADISIVDGKVKVLKVYCAVDCGRVINYAGAENQIEGGIIDGLGHALFGELTFDKGMAKQKNFNTYKLIRMADAPEIEVQFVKNEINPQGLGEPCLPPIGAAVANAVFAATGQRLSKLPIALQPLTVGPKM